MFSKHCGRPRDARINKIKKAFALSEFINVVGNTQIGKQKIRMLCHKCYDTGRMGALWIKWNTRKDV